jgi:hypothetical protein
VALTGTSARGGGQARELEGGRRSRRRAKARRVSGAWSGSLRRGQDRRPRRWGGEARGQREGGAPAGPTGAQARAACAHCPAGENE